MPDLWACTQILWSKLWITRARLRQPPIRQGLQAPDHFSTSLVRANRSLFKHLALNWCQVQAQGTSKGGTRPQFIGAPAIS